MNFIKGLLGIGLLASAIYIGFGKFPLWSVPALSLFFTAAYIQGKWYLWNMEQVISATESPTISVSTRNLSDSNSFGVRLLLAW